MGKSLKILVWICVAILVVSVIGALALFVLGLLVYAVVCVAVAVVFLPLSLVLSRDLRISRIIEENEFPDEE